VVSLLHFDGPHDGLDFIDETGRVWTRAVGTYISVLQSRFGGASGDFGGSGTYISAAHDAALSASGGVDMTWELFVRPRAQKTTACLATKRPTSGSSEWFLVLEDGRPSFYCWRAGNAVSVSVMAADPVPLNKWTFIAVSIVDNVARLFVNGALAASGTLLGPIAGNTAPVYIGRDPTNAGRNFDGFIDEYRQTKGVGRYTGSFTPPIAAFPGHGVT